MGRRKKTKETVERHVRIRKDFANEIEAEARRQEISFNQGLNTILEKGFRSRASKYKGFREVQMGKDFTCFECQRKFNRGTMAMWDRETGATLCLECAIENELTTKAVVRLIIQRLRLKRDIKALKVETEKNAEKYNQQYINQTENIAEITLFDKDLALKPKLETLMKQNLKYFQITKIEEEKKLMNDIAELYQEIIVFLHNRKTEKNRIMSERQRLLEEKRKREVKRENEQQSYAM